MPKVKIADTAAIILSLYPAGADLPAVGVSIVANLGGDRQMTVQTFYPVGSDPAAVNALIDSLMVPVGRQKAMAEVIELTAEAGKIGKTLAQFTEDYSRIEGEHAAAQARRAVEVEEMRKAADAAVEAAQVDSRVKLEDALAQRNEEFKQGHEEHLAARRTGDYVPKGHRKANLDRLDDGMRKLANQHKAAIEHLRADFDKLIADKSAEIETADAERDQHKQNLEISMKRHRDEADRLAGEIAARTALIG